LALPSPFNFARQAMLYVPRDLPDPTEPAFLDEAVFRMEQLLEVTKGRAFLLFTSHRNLRAAVEQLRAANLPYQLLVQGDKPRTALLDDFRPAIATALSAPPSS